MTSPSQQLSSLLLDIPVLQKLGALSITGYLGSSKKMPMLLPRRRQVSRYRDPQGDITRLRSCPGQSLVSTDGCRQQVSMRDTAGKGHAEGAACETLMCAKLQQSRWRDVEAAVVSFQSSAEVKMSLNLLLAAAVHRRIDTHHDCNPSWHGIMAWSKPCSKNAVMDALLMDIPFHVANTMMDTSARRASAKEGLLELSDGWDLV